MSTRSHIGIRNADGSLDVIDCHWDGYLSSNGAVLSHHDQEPEKMRELIALEDYDSLAAFIKTRGEQYQLKPDASLSFIGSC